MLDRLQQRLTYANVMATIAVFGVLAGGGAYAASKIGASDIAKNAVRSKHIKKSAVKSKHVKDGQLRVADLADEAKGACVRIGRAEQRLRQRTPAPRIRFRNEGQ